MLDALEKLGFNDFKRDAVNVLNDCKQAAAKRRRQSTRLENLGIDEDELLRQQQELFAQQDCSIKLISTAIAIEVQKSSTLAILTKTFQTYLNLL